MKRIAFLVQANQTDWLGGFNYLRNLVKAIWSNPERTLEPVLIVHPSVSEEVLLGFPDVEVIRTSLVNSRHPARFLSKVLFSFFDRDPTLEFLLKRHHIDAISHSLMTGLGGKIALISWIPDFQHIRLPQYFSQKQRNLRNKQFMKLANVSNRVILSSYDAKNDFNSFAPHAVDKVCVLHFVSTFEDVGDRLSKEKLCERFNIDRPFFYLPNQFWVHKNHALVVEALDILRSHGIDPLVLASGQQRDHRRPNYFQELMDQVKYRGLGNNFRVLGLVSLPELHALMLNTLSIINPSNFEGWSTTVEESKSLGVPIILSDIPVHLEQAPALGRYFQAGSAKSLAEAMQSAIREYDPVALDKARGDASFALPGRVQDFARAYERIAIEAIDALEQALIKKN